MSKTQCFQVSVACTHVCSMNVHMSESKASHRVPSTTAPATSYMVSRLSHASVRAVHYNPFLDCVFSWMSLRLFTAPRPQATLALRKLKRDSSVFVTVDTSKVPEGPGLGVLSLFSTSIGGYFLPGVLPTLLQQLEHGMAAKDNGTSGSFA